MVYSSVQAWWGSCNDGIRSPQRTQANSPPPPTSVPLAHTPSFRFSYEARHHADLPHVVKFSGGRSSGLLLLILVESGLLSAARGDVVVFNNTSAEHPETYRFARQCKEVVENRYGIPFFCVEFQTYEDARNGRWTRLPSYRMVQMEPCSDTCPDGYHGDGEVFEELLSWAGYVPNIFHRTCTKHLKLEVTRSFLKEWFTAQASTGRLGHFNPSSQIEDDDLYDAHLRSGGKVPREIFLDKKAFVRSRPVCRPAQRYGDYSWVAKPFQNPALEQGVVANSVTFGKNGVEYLAFVGLRFDEKNRVVKVSRRNAAGPASTGHEGEHVYMPLHDMGLTEQDVNRFWNEQNWGLDLKPEDGLSNCTYCFLKGARTLQSVNEALRDEAGQAHANSPCDLNWWVEKEEKYGRNLEAEGREIRSKVPGNFIGFFDSKRGFSYRSLLDATTSRTELPFDIAGLPCDCTD